MKNNSCPIPDSNKKIKNKPSAKIINNFSEKYFQFTKERQFANTPKKSHHQNTRDITSPRDSKDWKH
jgi:hypothetical protein